MPRRLGEILREPGLLGAAAGGILVLAFMRRRAALLVAAGFVSIAAFCVLAAAGLPILGRYLLAARRDPGRVLRRGRVRLAAAAAATTRGARAGRRSAASCSRAFVVFAPGPGRPDRRPARVDGDPVRDPRRPARDRRTHIRCEPVARPQPPPGPARRAVDRTSRRARSSRRSSSSPRRASTSSPASERVLRNFTLDPRDPKRLTAAVPPRLRARRRERARGCSTHAARRIRQRDRVTAQPLPTWARRSVSSITRSRRSRSAKPAARAAATCSLTRCTWVSIAIGSPSAPSKWVGIPVAMMKCGWKQTSTNVRRQPRGLGVQRLERRQVLVDQAADGDVVRAARAPSRSRRPRAASGTRRAPRAREHLRRQVDAVDRVHPRAQPLAGAPGPAAEIDDRRRPTRRRRRRAGRGPSRP